MIHKILLYSLFVSLFYFSVGDLFSADIANSSFKSKIRVKIGSNLKTVTVKGTDLKRYLYISKDLKKYSGTKRVRFHCKKRIIKPYKKVTRLAQIKSQTGILTWNKNRYRGELLILSNMKGGCDLINIIPIESYISTLLAREMNSLWPIEALKAQAIAARTYAIYKIKSKQVSRKIKMNAYYDIESSEKHQVSGSFFDATALTRMAAKATKGQILVTKNKKAIVPIFYHSKCGGRTLLPDQVWSNQVKGYRSVSCSHCSVSGTKTWHKKITVKRFKEFVKWLIKKGYISKKTPTKKIVSGRIYQPSDELMKTKIGLYLDDYLLIINKSLFRRYFGKKHFPSNRFSLLVSDSWFKFTGEGLGHGVGMCQIGALYMAKNGKSAKDILDFYYSGHKVRRIY